MKYWHHTTVRIGVMPTVLLQDIFLRKAKPMKKIKRIMLFVCMLIVCAMGLCACAGVPKEKEVITDIEEVLKESLGDAEKIDNIEILQRNTEKDAKTDTIYCKVDSSSSDAAYQKYYVVLYHLYDDGWGFESINFDKMDQWSSEPLTGANDEMIYTAIIGETFAIDGENWYIEERNVGEIKIVDRNTQLDQKKDTVTASVELLSDVLMAHGEIQVDFLYKEGWIINNFQITESFTSSYQAGKELEVSDNELVMAMVNVPLYFNENSYGKEQVLSVMQNEVSNFVISDSLVSNKGTCKTYNCSFVLNKEVAAFSVDVAILYQYSMNGWSVTEVNYPVVTISDTYFNKIGGTWKGQMSEFDTSSYHMQSVIIEITDDGYVTASVDVSAENRSCILKGYIDTNDLSISLKFEEWIKEPSRLALIYKPSLYGIIMAEDTSIKCIDTTETNKFEISR